MHAIDKLSLQSWLSSELEQYGIDSKIYARHILDLFFNSGYKTDLLLSERERNIFSYITDCPKKSSSSSKLKRKAESRSNSFPCTCDDDEVWKKQMAVERLLAAADDDVAASNINNIKDLIEKLHDLIKALKDESDSDDAAARVRMKKPKENYNQAFPSLLLRPVTLQHISNTAWNKYHIIKLEQEESNQAPVVGDNDDGDGGDDKQVKSNSGKESCLVSGVGKRVVTSTSQAHSKQTRLSNRERRHPYVKKKKKQALAKTHQHHHHHQQQQQQRKNRSKQQQMMMVAGGNKSGGKVRGSNNNEQRSTNTPLAQLSSSHPTSHRLPLFEKMSQQKCLARKSAAVSSPDHHFDVSGRRSKSGASSGRNSVKHNSRQQQQKWYNKEDGVKNGEANNSCNHKRLPLFHHFSSNNLVGGGGRWKDKVVRSAPTDDGNNEMEGLGHHHYYTKSRDEQIGLFGGRRRGDKFVYPSYEEYMKQQFGADDKNSLSSPRDSGGGSIWNHYYLPVSMRSDFVSDEQEYEEKKKMRRSRWFRDPLTGLLNFIPASASSHLFISECEGDDDDGGDQVEVWKYCPSPNLWQLAHDNADATDVGLEGGRSSRLETIYTSGAPPAANLLDALDSINPPPTHNNDNDDSNDEVIRREWQQYEAIFTQIQSATPGPNAIGAGGDCGEDNSMMMLNNKKSAATLHDSPGQEKEQGKDEGYFLQLADVDKNKENREGSEVGISDKQQDTHYYHYDNSPWHQQHSRRHNHVFSDSLVNVDKWLSEMMHYNNNNDDDDNKTFSFDSGYDLLADNKHSVASSVKMKMMMMQHQTTTKSTSDDVFCSSSPSLSSSSTFFHQSTSNKLKMGKDQHFTSSSSSSSSSGDYHLFTSSSSCLGSPPNISSRSSSLLWTEEEEMKKVNKCDDNDSGLKRHLISNCHHHKGEEDRSYNPSVDKQAVDKQHGCEKRLSASLNHLHIISSSSSQSRDEQVVDPLQVVDGCKQEQLDGDDDSGLLNYSLPCDVGYWWKPTNTQSPNHHQHVTTNRNNDDEDEVVVGCDGGVRACGTLFNIFNFNLFNLVDFPPPSSSTDPLTPSAVDTSMRDDDDDAVKLKDKLDSVIRRMSHTELGDEQQMKTPVVVVEGEGRSSLAQHNMNNNSTAVPSSPYNAASMSCEESGELSALIESCVNSHDAWKTRVRMSNIWEWVSGIRPVDVLYNEKQQRPGDTVTLQPSALTHFRPIRCKESSSTATTAVAEINAPVKMSANNDEVWWHDKHNHQQQHQQSWLDPILLKRDNENVNAVVEGFNFACVKCEPPDTVENSEISNLLKVVASVDKQQQQQSQQHCTCNHPITSQHDLIVDTQHHHHRPTGEDKCLQTSFEQQIQLIDRKLRCELSIRPLKANSR